MKILPLILAFALLIPSVLAAEGSIKLLALLEDEGGSRGTIADLQLKTVHGSEHVYLDTFPLTKIATQVSLRFAEQVSCSELDIDCSTTDFLYTIRAAPGIIGGPSAGAAAAVLTTALMDGRRLDPTVAITGTINSGGFIGPVGGVQQKLEAAAENGIKTVLIPKGTALVQDENKTLNLIEYGEELGIEVIEIATLDEAMTVFTGRPIRQSDPVFTLDASYQQTMKEVAQSLCNRYEKTDDERVANLTTIADTFFATGEYYSAASYCFRANINARESQLQDISAREFRELAQETALAATRADERAETQPLTTLTDIQTYMLVKERIFETKSSVISLSLSKNVTETEIRELAYAQERLSSAESWARFFGTGSQEYRIDNETLAQSCYAKIGEAEERYNYVQSLFPNTLKATRQTLNRATQEAKDRKFVLCLHDAAKAKSEADSLISVTGVSEGQLQEIIDVKLDATKRGIGRAQAKGTFPLIGYAYYEYAKALKTEDPYSSLLFSEYASELSNLDIYFTKHKRLNIDYTLVRDIVLSFIIGVVIGGLFVASRRLKPRKK